MDINLLPITSASLLCPAASKGHRWLTCWTSMPRASRSVVIRTRVEPERNSRMMTSRVFWSMSPWVALTVKSRFCMACVSQSTCSTLGSAPSLRNVPPAQEACQGGL